MSNTFVLLFLETLEDHQECVIMHKNFPIYQIHTYLFYLIEIQNYLLKSINKTFKYKNFHIIY